MTFSSPVKHELPPVVVSRRQFRAEFVFHLVLLLAAVAVIVMSFLMRLVGDNLVFMPGSVWPIPETCAARQWLGIDCPGCGLTRSFIAISSGDLARAWNFNPAGFVLYLFVVGQIPWRLFQMGRRANRKMPVFNIWLFLPLAIAVAALLTQWIGKLVS